MTDLTFKIVFTGFTNTGKSSIIKRYIDNTFKEGGEAPTIAGAYSSKMVRMSNGFDVKLTITDTAGQERFSALVPMYYRGAHCVVAVYDVTDRDTLDVAKRYVDEVRLHSPSDVRIVLLGNKIDLAEQRVVHSFDTDLQEYVKEFDLIYAETSAATGEGIDDMFLTAVDAVYATQSKKQPQQDVDVMKSIDLSKASSNQHNQKSGGCC